MNKALSLYLKVVGILYGLIVLWSKFDSCVLLSDWKA